MSDLFREAMLLRVRAEIEALVSKREGMIAANQIAAFHGNEPHYEEGAFEENASDIMRAAPDPHSFS